MAWVAEKRAEHVDQEFEIVGTLRQILGQIVQDFIQGFAGQFRQCRQGRVVFSQRLEQPVGQIQGIVVILQTAGSTSQLIQRRLV